MACCSNRLLVRSFKEKVNKENSDTKHRLLKMSEVSGKRKKMQWKS